MTTGNKMVDEAKAIKEYSTQEYATEVKIKSGSSCVFRIIDGSESYRRYYISWMQCDDDTIKPFITENDSQGKGILARIFGDQDNFYKGGYLESKKGQFGKVNIHQAKDPELFKRLTEYWNPAYLGTGSAKPKREYIYNILHRDPELINNMMLNWCDANKRTKITRFGSKAFKGLAVVFENDGEFWEYDIVFSKTGDGSDTVNTVMKAGKNTAHTRFGLLTEEEKNYERYDLDNIVRLPSAFYILKNLRNTIERIDMVMGTSYLKELDEQRKIEEEEYNKHQADYDQKNHTTVPNTVTPPQGNPFDDSAIPFDNSNQVQAQIQRRVVVPATPAQQTIINQQQPIVQQPIVQQPIVQQPIVQQPIVQQPIVQQPIIQQQPIQQTVINQQPVSRVPINTAMSKCGHCGADIPSDLATCPKCAGVLLSECDVCHNNFSTFANVCPYCNTVYKLQ